MKPPAKRQLHIAGSLAEALDMHERFGAAAEFFAGGTWIMRADLREEFEERHYISLAGLDGMADIDITPEEITIGAGVTHARLAEAIGAMPEAAALAMAAAKSANPAIRHMATVGGNLCTSCFAAADLLPALLCLSASVEVAAKGSHRRMSLETFLSNRGSGPAAIVTRVFVPRHPCPSAHARLPLKKAGDYPVAIVSASVAFDKAHRITEARIAVGSVEPVARRWTALEAVVTGALLNPDDIAVLAARHAGQFQGRDGIEAPGWYRIKVLPALVRRAFEDLLASERRFQSC